MLIREPKFKLGDYVTDRLGFAGRVENILSYRFSDKNYIYDVSPLDENDNWREFAESRLTPYIKKPKSVWDLKEGDTYYLIVGDGKVTEPTWGCCDKKLREIGNTFLTKEEAEFEVERRKIETEMLRLGGRRVFKKGENNYYIVCDFSFHYDIRIYKEKDGSFGKGMIYFDSIKECKNAIDSIGEGRIKKYYFGVEE